MTDTIRDALKECAMRCRYDGDLFHDQGNEMRRDASWKAAGMAEAAIDLLAAPPASPLRGREDLAPGPCSDLSIGELIEWLDNPQWTNGYLNSDAANHMSAAAELIERLVSSAPPEQPAAASGTGRQVLAHCDELHDLGFNAGWNGAIEECITAVAKVMRIDPQSAGGPIFDALRSISASPPEQPAADPAGREEIARAFLYETGMFDNEAEIKANPEHRLVKAAYAAADRLLSPAAPEPRCSSGEPIHEDNYMSNDLDKGDDA